MGVLYFLIPACLFAALGFLAAFIWAVQDGQYDDSHTPAMRILLEDTGSVMNQKNQD